jgi:Flp pilus assembly protein TadG
MMTILLISNLRRSRFPSRRGTTLVEFALVVPIVFILFFAAVEFARVAMIRHTIDNAVYEAARFAMVPGGTAAAAQAEARRLLSIVGVNNPSIEVNPAVINRSTERVTVRIAVPVDTNLFVPPQYFAGQSLTREITLRREGLRSSAR